MGPLKLLAELFFPSKCVLCRKLLKRGETDLCRDCREHTREYPKGNLKLQFLDSWSAVWYYEDSVRGSLLRYKFNGQRSYAQSYGRLLAMRLLREYPEGFEVLTWVPVSNLRRLRRGYDQVELLAKAVGRELGMEPVRTLTKIRNNPPQSGLRTHAQRRANVTGVYQTKNEARILGKRVLILDDILTTGATVSECARLLKTAGAESVCCGVMAVARDHK